MMAKPRADRWHGRPTALLGGVGIYLAFMAGYALLGPRQAAGYPILIGGSLLFFTGLVDDRIQIKPYTKLILQLIAAAIAVYMGLRLPWTQRASIDDLITILWLVGVSNAINLLDNMDGLAAGITVIACAFLFVSFLANGQAAEALLPCLLAGATLGFLAFNFKPASIFMGDSGSMFLGFVLGATALLSDYGRSRNLGAVLFAPVLILLIPIFDTCFVTLTRKFSGRAVSHGGRDHTSHRLVALGISERRTVSMLYLFAVVSGAVALLVRRLNVEETLLLVPLFGLTVVFMGIYLGKVRVYRGTDFPKGSTVIKAFSASQHKRRVVEILLDLLLIVLAYYGAYMLRFDGSLPREQVEILVKSLPLVIIAQMLFFLIGGMYRGLWRYMGVGDFLVMGRSVVFGAALSAAAVFAFYKPLGPSRAVFILNGLLLFMLVSASRMSFRVIQAMVASQAQVRPEARRVLIYGAGDGGEMLVRELLNNPHYCCAPVGFVDDDAEKVGKIIHGYRIFNTDQLPEVIDKHKVSEVIVSSPKVSDSRLNTVRHLGVSLRRMSIRFE
jgi:UDP-GlcNAc:undecaprenyl-phosphate GlcNAc-1-phosphate transferase